MNNMHKFMIAVLGYIVLHVGAVDAIECFVCKSEINAECENSSPGNHFLANCSDTKEGPKYIACRKMEIWVDFKVLDQQPMKRIVRQCAEDVDKDRPCYYRAGFGGRVNVCDCFEDKCNSASLPVVSLITLAITLVSFLRSIS